MENHVAGEPRGFRGASIPCFRDVLLTIFTRALHKPWLAGHKLRGGQCFQKVSARVELGLGRLTFPAVYPWGSLPANSTVVDVGGGNGHATLDLLKAFPFLKIIVQDTPPVAIQGKEVYSYRPKIYININIGLLVLGERVPNCDSRQEG